MDRYIIQFDPAYTNEIGRRCWRRCWILALLKLDEVKWSSITYEITYEIKFATIFNKVQADSLLTALLTEQEWGFSIIKV